MVAEASLCGWLLVPAIGPDGPAQALVRADAPGVALHPLEGLDVSRSWSRLVLDDVAVRPPDIVGPPGEATVTAMEALSQLAAVLVAAESVGAMDHDFEMTLQYAKDRIAFGRPIGSFQALKHLLADTSLSLEMSKATGWPRRARVGSGDDDGPEAASIAKAFVGEPASTWPRLLPGLRRHRLHVGARPAPLPAAPRRRRRTVRRRRPGTASACCQLAGL